MTYNKKYKLVDENTFLDNILNVLGLPSLIQSGFGKSHTIDCDGETLIKHIIVGSNEVFAEFIFFPLKNVVEVFAEDTHLIYRNICLV